MTKLRKLSKKAYRDVYVPSRVRATIAMQVRALRKALGLTQKAFASRVGTTQSAVSDLENPDGEHVSVQTLLNVAAAADVSLIVRFASFPDFLKLMADMSPEGLRAESIGETVRKLDQPLPSITSRDISRIRVDADQSAFLRGAAANTGSVVALISDNTAVREDGEFQWQTIQSSRQPFDLPISGTSTLTTVLAG